MTTTDPLIASMHADIARALELLQEWHDEITTKVHS
jgi:hypothetical protein